VLCGRGASETSADGTCGTPASGASALGVGMAFGPACGKAEETSAAEKALEEAAYSLSLGDAKGHEHRVTDVEYGAEKQTKNGGSTRTVTLVTH